jgi:ABC-type sugar transport system permease subunit
MTDQRVGLLFALPAIILLVGILGFPAVAAILQSFNLIWGTCVCLKLANYTSVVGDAMFFYALCL